MDSRIAQLAAATLPFTTADAARCGVDRFTLARMARAGQVKRVCHGAFVPAGVWAGAGPERRHLLVARGVLGRYRSVVLSHVSAVVAHDLPTYRVDLGTVHLTRTAAGRTGRIGWHPTVRIHPALPCEAVADVAGLPVCTVAIAVLQLADTHGVEAGMVGAEAALHGGSSTAAELRRARELVRLGRGRAHADMVVRDARGASESPGETLTRLLLRTLGVPEPQQQARIRLPSGAIARVDFLLAEHAVVVEFDGAVKYEGVSGRDALVREKRREDGLRAAGFRVVRLTWPDLQRPGYVRDLLRRARS